jgi:hypothetical protein
MNGKPSGGGDGSDYTLALTDKQKEHANLFASLTEKGMHAPALDIDFKARLIPSSTIGHYHLYLDKEICWDDYAKLIAVMGEIGLIEPGYAEVSLKKGMTTLRKPGIVK